MGYHGEMGQALPPSPPAIEAPVETRNPLAGFAFSGSKVSLAKLKAAAETAGLRLEPYSMPGQPSSLLIAGADAFDNLDAVMALWNKAANGTFGPIIGSLVSEPPAR